MSHSSVTDSWVRFPQSPVNGLATASAPFLSADARSGAAAGDTRPALLHPLRLCFHDATDPRRHPTCQTDPCMTCSAKFMSHDRGTERA